MTEHNFESHEGCTYLGNDAWDCGHIDNSDSDDLCDCHVRVAKAEE